jgi:hypothetical protein
MSDNWCKTFELAHHYTQWELDLFSAWHEFSDRNPKATEFLGSFHVFEAGYKAARPRPEHDPVVKVVKP